MKNEFIYSICKAFTVCWIFKCLVFVTKVLDFVGLEWMSMTFFFNVFGSKAYREGIYPLSSSLSTLLTTGPLINCLKQIINGFNTVWFQRVKKKFFSTREIGFPHIITHLSRHKSFWQWRRSRQLHNTIFDCFTWFGYQLKLCYETRRVVSTYYFS